MTLTAIVVYTFVSYSQFQAADGQLKIAQGSLEATKSQLQEMQYADRPWVFADTPNALKHYIRKRRTKVGFRLTLTNYGKSPALHTAFKTALLNPGMELPFSGAQFGLFGTPLDTWFQMEESNGGAYSESALPPNGQVGAIQDWESAGNMTNDQAQEIISSDQILYLVAVVQYQDASGHSYTTEFCEQHLATGFNLFCQTHNIVI